MRSVRYSWPLVKTSGYKMINVFCVYPQEITKTQKKLPPLTFERWQLLGVSNSNFLNLGAYFSLITGCN